MMNEENSAHILLQILHQFQLVGHLCDLTLVSSDGQEVMAHAAVLAGSSSLLKDQLQECDRGLYRVTTSFSTREILAFIEYAYTGETTEPTVLSSMDLDLHRDKLHNFSHSLISLMHDFADNGLFCHMTCHTLHGNVQPAHNYLVAAKYPFLSQHISHLSMLTVNLGISVQSYFYCLNNMAVSFIDYVNPDDKEALTIDLPTTTYYTCDNSTTALLPDQTRPIYIKRFAPKQEKLKLTEQIHACKTCGKVLFCLRDLHKHEEIHIKGKQFICETCGKAFMRRNCLNRHKAIHTNDRSYVCEICDKSFILRNTLKLHLLIHSDAQPAFECDTCDKVFANKRYLKVHQRLHSDIKPYTCKLCSYQCKDKQALERHHFSHTHEKRIVCEQCGKGLGSKASLKSHQQLIHMDYNDRQHACDKCDKRFANVSHLNSHKLYHASVRPHVCETCKKGFTQFKDLKIHQRIHSNVRPYTCETCGKGFRQNSGLTTHKLIHTKEKPHVCTKCYMRFTYRINLRKHLAIHENDLQAGSLIQ